MPGYCTRLQHVNVAGVDYVMRTLSDRQQYADPHGDAERAGISSAQWCLFGQLWPSGLVLAEAVSRISLGNRRMLELGCGLGLGSLLLQSRGADITASDHHPLAQQFLRENARGNRIPELPYADLPWAVQQPTIGRFDLIIASDVLYERTHAELLANVLDRHANRHAECLLTDPGRNNSAPFTRAMTRQGYSVSEVRSPFNDTDLPPYRGKLLRYQR